ncbi:hypothetical protein [Massilia sp. erpn]|uniref:hypothetical protein n=1 Tax=Massilia sp. erpn TaxID=2738142 RepID=UPI0021041A87|nr:hypothetical protein [Massilia sp. erpn]UTY58627.1 hypothetical protein HPQ68_16415 [Massilia sp. erpn]
MGWFLINIALPIGAPLLTLLFLKALPLPRSAKPALNLMTPLKDGQLCWASLVFCASALYEIAVQGRYASPTLRFWFDYISAGLVILIVGSSILAGGGAIFSTKLRRSVDVSWARHFSGFLFSILLTTCAAALFTVVHFASG